MKLHYIYHSGFAIEVENKNITIIIDYFKDSAFVGPDFNTGENVNLAFKDVASVPAFQNLDGKDGFIHSEILNKPGRIYVLSSHFHLDHFNPIVLSWQDDYKTFHEKGTKNEITYVLSNDILKRKRASKGDANFIRKGKTYSDENIQIDAIGSTDVGCSFLITIDGKKIFHAGDLNNWKYNENLPLKEKRKSDGDFLAEINFLKKYTDSVDVTLFPIDRRIIGDTYTRGATQFIENIKTKLFVPMHFSEDYQGGNSFRKIAEEHGCKFFEIHKRGDFIEF